jgi:hypothetical protein
VSGNGSRGYDAWNTTESRMPELAQRPGVPPWYPTPEQGGGKPMAKKKKKDKKDKKGKKKK